MSEPHIITKMNYSFHIANFQRYDFLAPNVYLTHDVEMDLLGIRKSGYIDEIEIKLTRADYLKDFKKTAWIKDRYQSVSKHEALMNGWLPQAYFSFYVPEGLIEVHDIPDYAGLYYFREKESPHTYRCTEVKKAPRLHKNKAATEAVWVKLGRKMMFRYWDTQGALCQKTI